MSMTTTSVQRAHEDLHNSGAPVANCPMCTGSVTDANHQMAEEETPVAADNTYTEAQHFALLTSAVERETAELSDVKTELESKVTDLQAEKASLETSNTDLQNKLDVIESEKAGETTRADAAEKALEDFKAELSELASVEARKTERLAAVKAADTTLGDDYFTDERVQRYAEMADDAFAGLVSDLTEAAAGKAKAEVTDPAETASAVEGQARETAAFTGGTTATTQGSALGSFLTATGKLPAAN